MSKEDEIQALLSSFEGKKNTAVIRRAITEVDRNLSRQDYRVVCDESNNTTENMNQHLLVVDVELFGELAVYARKKIEEYERLETMKRNLIGFTGERNSGKTTATNYIAKHYKVEKGHMFGAGKAMVVAYLRYIGIARTTAHEMVYGSLKDKPCPQLPGGVACRYFMEHLGHFMGTSEAFGPAWTFGGELKALDSQSDLDDFEDIATYIFESVAYEEPEFRKEGGIIIQVIGNHGPQEGGVKTSDAVSSIVPDFIIVNDGTLDEFYAKIDALMLQFNVPRKTS